MYIHVGRKHHRVNVETRVPFQTPFGLKPGLKRKDPAVGIVPWIFEYIEKQLLHVKTEYY